MLVEFSGQRAVANPAWEPRRCTWKSRGDRAALLAPLPLSFLPGPAGSLRSGGDSIAAGGASGLWPRLQVLRARFRFRGSGSRRADVM